MPLVIPWPTDEPDEMDTVPAVITLDRQACLARLASVPVGRLGVSLGALPAIRAVRFALTPAHIVFRAAPGSGLARGARGVVAFQADHYDPGSGSGWCVEVLGHSEEVTDPALVDELASLPLGSWSVPDASDHLFRLAMDIVTGQEVRLPA